MSNNWRIQASFDDRSAKVLAEPSAGRAFTVIDAPRGGIEPIKFSAGQTARILENYGTPSADNLALLEALVYNQKYPIYISAPQGAGGRVGGVLVTKTGITEFPSGVAPAESFSDLANVIAVGDLGTGNDIVTDFTTDIDGISKYKNESIQIYVNNESVGELDIVVTGDVEDFSVSSGTYSGLTGSLDRSTSSLSVLFPSAITDGESVSYGMTMDLSGDGIVAVIKNKNPQADDLGIKGSYDTEYGKFTFDVARKDSLGAFTELSTSPYTVSLDPESTDGFGITDYILNAMESDFFEVVLLEDDKVDLSGFIDVTSYISFNGGKRGAKATGSDLVAGYEYAKQRRKYSADIFFDATGDSAVAGAFASLRNGSQIYSKYLLPLPPVDVDEAKTSYQELNLDSKGIHCFWNWGIVTNAYSTSGNVASSLMGDVAMNYADSLTISKYALAVAWTDENGVGGQLKSGRVVEMLYDADEDELLALDTMGINPIDNDPTYGVMIKSRRTTQKALTDYSFSDYAGMSDLIMQALVTKVLPMQIIKLNDVAHRSRVASMATAIISPYTVAPFNGIESFAVKCDHENNNDEVLAREEFVLQVAIKFSRKSRMLILTLANLPSGQKVSEAWV